MSEKDFVDFIDTNQGIIHKICRIYTGNEADYEDLFQEIMLQLWQSVNRYKGDAKLTTWMYRVGLFTALTRKKKEQKLQFVDQAHNHEPFYTPDPVDDQEAELLAAIKKLNASDRGLVMLYLDNKSYKEMSEILGLTESNVGVRLNRIKVKLKEILTRHERT